MNASAAINFPRLDGLTLKDSSVEIHGYMNKSVYLPQEEATKTFERLSASNTKGASIQAMDKLTHTETVKIPAWSDGGVSGDASGVHTTFTAYFILSCDNVEENVLLLPSKVGNPTMGASDYVVQPPFQGGFGVVPFHLHIISHGTSKLALPSRASAALDAKLRGVPTYWIKPPLNNEDDIVMKFTSPALVAPLFRFRCVNESDDCDKTPITVIIFFRSAVRGRASVSFARIEACGPL